LLLFGGCGGGSSGSSGGGGGTPTPQAAPTITAQPNNVSAQEAGTAQFQVQATGSGTLSYQWQRNAMPIAGATQASLSLSPVQLSDNGAMFAVVVSNSVGSVTSTSATLTVQVAPLAVTLDRTSVVPFGKFILTGTKTVPVSTSGFQTVNESYSVEYTLGTGVVVTVPALIESDGSIHGVAPPGVISGGQLGGGDVGIRVKRTVQTNPTASPSTDFSNSVTLTVQPALPLITPPGYSTTLLMVVGKYLAQDAATHNNALVDPTTAQMLTSFDFDGQANKIAATTDVAVLQMLDSFSAGALLTAYQYDVNTGAFVPAASPASASNKLEVAGQTGPIRSRGRRLDASDPGIQSAAQQIANQSRTNASYFITAGKVLGVVAAVAAVGVGSSVAIPVAVLGATLAGVGVMAGTALSLGFDMAASIADPSANAESRLKSITPSLKFFSSNMLAATIDATINPADGLANEYMQQHLPPGTYLDYQAGGAFLLATSDSLSQRIVGYEEGVTTSDPTTPLADTATLNADIQATAATAVSDALDAGNTIIPSATASGGDLSALSNELLTLGNVLQTLSQSPGNQYGPALQTFSTCSMPFDNDILNLANAIVASGGMVDDQEIAQATADIQGILNCGSALTGTLASGATTASNTQTGMSGSDQVTVTATACDAGGNGCWITERTHHADGSTSEETGYVACHSDGFCPLFLH
jgi:Immunoglobulin I-set domain